MATFYLTIIGVRERIYSKKPILEGGRYYGTQPWHSLWTMSCPRKTFVAGSDAKVSPIAQYYLVMWTDKLAAGAICEAK